MSGLVQHFGEAWQSLVVANLCNRAGFRCAPFIDIRSSSFFSFPMLERTRAFYGLSQLLFEVVILSAEFLVKHLSVDVVVNKTMIGILTRLVSWLPVVVPGLIQSVLLLLIALEQLGLWATRGMRKEFLMLCDSILVWSDGSRTRCEVSGVCIAGPGVHFGGTSWAFIGFG